MIGEGIFRVGDLGFVRDYGERINKVMPLEGVEGFLLTG